MAKKKSLLSLLSFTSVIGIFISSIVISGFFLTYLYLNSKEETFLTYESNLSLTNNSIELFNEDIRRLGIGLSVDKTLDTNIDRYYNGDLSETVDAKNTLNYILGNAASLVQYVQNICIYSNDDIYYYNSYFTFEKLYSSQITAEPWFLQLQKNEIESITIPNYIFKNYNNTIEKKIYLYALKTRSSYKLEEKIIIITVDLNRIKQAIDKISYDENTMVALFDSNDALIYSVGVDFDSSSYDKMKLVDSRSKIQIDGKNYFVLKNTNSQTGWKMLYVLPTSSFFENIFIIQPYIIGIILFFIISTLLVQFYIFKKVTKPILNLVTLINNMDSENLVNIDVKSQYIETTQLEQSFNNLIFKVNNLIISIKENESIKRKIEYKVLESQINPHFIYNTLDGVKWLALMNNDKKVAEMIGYFVKLLQISLSNGEEIILIKTELELVQSYVKIMEFRNNFSIRVEYIIDEELLEYKTLKLIIQPFVENCYMHAFNNNDGFQKIVIEVYKESDKIIIKITDNGQGFESKNFNKRSRMFSGIGIENVMERIKLWHGVNFGITIISNKAQGTIVIISQPFL